MTRILILILMITGGVFAQPLYNQSNSHIIDSIGLLTVNEERILNSKLQKYKFNKRVDIKLHLVGDISKTESIEYQNNFKNKSESSIMNRMELYISPFNNKYLLIKDRVIDRYLTNESVKNIFRNKVAGYFKTNAYFSGLMNFVKEVEDIINSYRSIYKNDTTQGGGYAVNNKYEKFTSPLSGFAILAIMIIMCIFLWVTGKFAESIEDWWNDRKIKKQYKKNLAVFEQNQQKYFEQFWKIANRAPKKLILDKDLKWLAALKTQANKIHEENKIRIKALNKGFKNFSLKAIRYEYDKLICLSHFGSELENRINEYENSFYLFDVKVNDLKELIKNYDRDVKKGVLGGFSYRICTDQFLERLMEINSIKDKEANPEEMMKDLEALEASVNVLSDMIKKTVKLRNENAARIVTFTNDYKETADIDISGALNYLTSYPVELFEKQIEKALSARVELSKIPEQLKEIAKMNRVEYINTHLDEFHKTEAKLNYIEVILKNTKPILRDLIKLANKLENKRSEIPGQYQDILQLEHSILKKMKEENIEMPDKFIQLSSRMKRYGDTIELINVFDLNWIQVYNDLITIKNGMIRIKAKLKRDIEGSPPADPSKPLMLTE